VSKFEEVGITMTHYIHSFLVM